MKDIGKKYRGFHIFESLRSLNVDLSFDCRSALIVVPKTQHGRVLPTVCSYVLIAVEFIEAWVFILPLFDQRNWILIGRGNSFDKCN